MPQASVVAGLKVTHGRYFLPAAELVARLAGAAQCRDVGVTVRA